ncbi:MULTISPECIES: DsbE family thiol:disulfide interchange protein [unclassified Cupriavidus]|uniref:DsbE family thiol:disulfide interchange protein n=1 Tax=Cupriavidus sp. H19C3 TaxID=3241603 RepID=UPI003BF7BBDF
MTRFVLPLVLFLALAAALAAGLRRDPRELPSALVGKPVPAFLLPVLAPGEHALSARDMHGGIWILNVWASWCTACRVEHPVLMDFAARSPVPVYGLNYKDEAAAARDWLRKLGDPYVASLRDADGRAGIDLGVYGVPETYVIDANGMVRYRHVGPVTEQVLEQQIDPLLRRLAREPGRG